MFTRDSVTIITATTGHRHLSRCLRSVQRQTYSGLEQLVVIDGLQHEQKVKACVAQLDAPMKALSVLTLPQPTGRDNWVGHRIYGGFSFLCNTEFVTFLDEDNWIDDDHVETMVAAMRTKSA